MSSFKHSKESLVYDPAADDELQDSLRREYGMDDQDCARNYVLSMRSSVGDPIVDMVELERMLKREKGVDDSEGDQFSDQGVDDDDDAEGDGDAERDEDDESERLRSAQTKRLVDDLRVHGPGAMAAFRAALADGKQPLDAVKLCFVGHARAGKTSTLRSLAGRAFNADEPSTHGVETASLRNELLRAEPSAARPWGDLGGGLRSVGELFESSVATTVAECLHAAAAAGGVESAPSPSSSSSALASAATPARAPCLRMPVDLIVRAVNQGPQRKSTRDIVMQTWDFAGDDLYYNMAHVFITPLGLYCLVLDLTTWRDQGVSAAERTNSLDFWLSAVFVHAPDAKLVIVGSHADAIAAAERAAVYQRVNDHLTERLERMPSLFTRLRGNEREQLLFFPVDNRRCSPDGQASVDNLRSTLNKLAIEIVDGLSLIPTRWAHFFHELSQTSQPYQRLDVCQRWAESFGLSEASGELQPCLALFHGLGQWLYFKGSDTVVLDPQWLLDAMAQVVACPRVLADQPLPLTAALRGHGRLSADLLRHLWHDARFQGHTETLEAFLEHFDLLVPAPREDGARWLVPSLLPRYGDPPRLDGAAVVLLDFHGALRKLLVTLLPRLLCQLQRMERTLRVHAVFRDFIKVRLASAVAGGSPLLMALELLPPEGPEMVRLSLASGVAGRMVEVPVLLDVLELIRGGLQAWLPQVSFAAKIPCPECCTGAFGGFGCGESEASELSRATAPRSQPQRHLLDLAEVGCERHLHCPAKHRPVDEERLPVAFQNWRQTGLGVASRVFPGADADVGLRHFAASLPMAPPNVAAEVWYLYASPVGIGQVDVASELRALQRIEGISAQVRVATVDMLREVLLWHADRAVVHLTAHCSMSPVPGVWLEHDWGGALGVTDTDLALIGPWNKARLLIFLGCGSEVLVRRLFAHWGPFAAICCSNPIFDSAARNFFKAFYHALGAGYPIKDCHAWAQQSVRCAGGGMQLEADKFVLIGWDEHSSAQGVVAAPSFAPPPSLSCHWPQGRRVEQYVSRNDVTIMVAKHFASGQRRTVLVWGPKGMGKTAFCREFCHYYSAPGGRLYSTAALFVDAEDLRQRPWMSDGSEKPDADGHPALAMCGSRYAGAAASSIPVDEVEPRDHLARAVLGELAERGPRSGEDGGPSVSTRASIAMGKAECPTRWESMIALAKQLDAMGRWLLVVDGLPDIEEVTPAGKSLVKALKDLLDATKNLHMLLTSRGHWKRFVDRKIVGVELTPLAPQQAAVLFARNVHRGLHPGDFAAGGDAVAIHEHGPGVIREEVARSGATTTAAPYLASSELRDSSDSVDVGGPQPLRLETAIDLLKDSPLLRALGGVPGRLIEAADEVDERLPSLLRHPFFGAPPAPD